jgi:hypothetical protein
MSKFLLSLNLQLFSEEMGAADPGVESVPAAEVPQDPGVETQAAAEPEKQNNFEKAFAKRLAEAQAKWEAEKQAEIQKLQEQYKDYDSYREVADYFRELNQAPDVMTLKERIEMERLQQRAEQENVPVEVLKRLQELEAKAAEAERLKQQQEEQERLRREEEERTKAYQEFRGKLDAFAKENGVEADKLYAFMVENQIGNMDAALKAMQYDDLKQKLEQAEKEGMKKLLSAKSKIPTVPSTTQTGAKVTAAPKTFAEARARAIQRLSNE